MKSKLINELENRVLKRKRVLKKPGTVDNGNLLVYYRENSESGAGSGGMGFWAVKENEWGQRRRDRTGIPRCLCHRCNRPSSPGWRRHVKTNTYHIFHRRTLLYPRGGNGPPWWGKPDSLPASSRRAVFCGQGLWQPPPQIAYAIEQKAHVVTRVSPSCCILRRARLPGKSFIRFPAGWRKLFYCRLLQMGQKGLSHPSAGSETARGKACGCGKARSPKGKPESTKNFCGNNQIYAGGLSCHHASIHLLRRWHYRGIPLMLANRTTLQASQIPSQFPQASLLWRYL